VRNEGYTRGYLSDVALAFSKSSPFTAPLAVLSAGNKDSAVVVDSHGTEVRADQWLFTAENDAVIISDAAYVQGETYTISYQGNDSSVGDELKTADLRAIKLIGSQVDQDQYKRNIDFFVETKTLPPAPVVDETGAIVSQANKTSVLTGVVKTAGAGTGTVELDPYAAFDHLYSRGYKLEVTAISGTAATFAWTATPLSSGNDSAVAVPMSSALPAPTFVVDSTDPQTLNVALEFSIRLNFAGSFAIGDTFTFSAYGPSLLEIDPTITNTNQFAEAGAVVPDLDNAATGSLLASAEDYAGSSNLKIRAQVTHVDSGSVSATLPTGYVEFSSVAPADGSGITIDNGRIGAARVAKTFEFDTDGVQSITGSTLVLKPTVAATPASGSVEFDGTATEAPADGTALVISDGVRTVTFEFDSDSQLTIPSAVRVLIGSTPGSQSAGTAANLATAINASALRITATDASAGNGNIGKVTLAAQVAGTVANVAIVVDTTNAASTGAAVLATGLAGGTDATTNLAATVANFVTAVNAAGLGIYATQNSANPLHVDLRHGAELVFSAQPADADSFTINAGSGASTFEFDNDATTTPTNVPVTIGGSLAATLAAAATAIESAIGAEVLVLSDRLLVVPTVGRNVIITESGANTSVKVSVVDDVNSLTNGNVAIKGANGLSNTTLFGFVGGTDATSSPDRISVAWGSAGDDFASGSAVLLDGVNTEIYRGIKLKLANSAAAPARGSVSLVSNPVDGNSVTITDGILTTAITFEFDNNATVSGGAVRVVIGSSAAATAANLAAAIAASALQLTVEIDGATVKLVNKKNGTGPANAYNTPITKTGAAISVVGFAGGKSNYVAGDKFTFTVKAARTFPTALDDRITTLTIQKVGLSSLDVVDPRYPAITFEFDNNATVSGGAVRVVIGSSAAATAANLAAAIAASALQLTVEIDGATVKLVNKKNGTGPANAYNTPITKTGAAISVVGFAGGKSNYVAGDKFTFTVKAARTFPTALDDRITTLTIQKVGLSSLDVVDPRYLRFVYESNTAEGGFGQIETTADENGYFTLPGQIKLAARNTSGSNRFAAGDKFSVQHVNNQRIFWNLDTKSTEAFTSNDVLTDRNGSVTGSFGAYYLSLANTPYASSLVVKLGGVATTDFKLIDGTSFMRLYVTDVTELAAGVSVSYTHRGNEPALGSSYYLTGHYKRPASYYNKPQLFTDVNAALEFLAPVTADNDLAIMANIAFKQANPPLAIATIQLEDADDDGVFSPADIDNALTAAEEVSYITDLTPIRLHSFISKFLAFNVKACDPFAKREHEQYFGGAVGTPIGDASTPGSLVYMAKNTLQIYGKSYAHGTRIMVAPRLARVTQTMTDGSIQTVTLDGSFVAGAVSACVAGSPNYSTTLLKSSLCGFDYLETFGVSANEKLGAAGIIFFSDAGGGVYTFEEDQTVDTYGAEFHEILPMRTKQDVTRIVRSELDRSVVGMVPNTRGDATATISARIMQVLIGLVNRNIIAPYQDDNGNARSINSGDVEVYVDENDPTLYYFYYTYYTRFAVKRLFGLYSVNKSISA
jgi:hypothetical protein